MKHLLVQLDLWFFGPELIYKYQDGTIVSKETASEWSIYE